MQPSRAGAAVASEWHARWTGDDPQPWLAELLHSPDPNVRIKALDAWARQPTASLDQVTYALVDPDERVRFRAQEVLEQELARLEPHDTGRELRNPCRFAQVPT